MLQPVPLRLQRLELLLRPIECSPKLADLALGGCRPLRRLGRLLLQPGAKAWRPRRLACSARPTTRPQRVRARSPPARDPPGPALPRPAPARPRSRSPRPDATPRLRRLTAPLGLGLGLAPTLQPRDQRLESPEGRIQLPLGRVEPCHTPTDSPFVAMPECHAAKAASTRLGPSQALWRTADLSSGNRSAGTYVERRSVEGPQTFATIARLYFGSGYCYPS